MRVGLMFWRGVTLALRRRRRIRKKLGGGGPRNPGRGGGPCPAVRTPGRREEERENKEDIEVITIAVLSYLFPPASCSLDLFSPDISTALFSSFSLTLWLSCCCPKVIRTPNRYQHYEAVVYVHLTRALQVHSQKEDRLVPSLVSQRRHAILSVVIIILGENLPLHRGEASSTGRLTTMYVLLLFLLL